jgi:hypothetical protein
VDIRLESRDGPVAPPGEDPTGELTVVDGANGALGWRRESTTHTVLDAESSPIPIPGTGRTYRLVVREIENLTPSSSPPAGPLPIDDPLVQELSVRTVFADVVPL